MAVIAVLCPHCNNDQVIKRGKTAGGKQRYRCLNPDCSHSSFVLNPAYAGRLPEVKQKIIDMALATGGVKMYKCGRFRNRGKKSRRRAG